MIPQQNRLDVWVIEGLEGESAKFGFTVDLNGETMQRLADEELAAVEG